MSDSPPQPPTVSDVLRASQLKDTLHAYGEALRARRKGIDKLNVYPVPDGDTGTNMSLTVQSVVAELKSAATDDMRSISTAISRGAIMGARGNSGAILAQALRGVAESAKEKTSLTPEDVAEAFEKARKGAYESVLKPVEGTILTVLSAAATAARKSADEGHKLKEQLDNVRAASAEALARTPELLPQLKAAGVVDAGGSGFLLFVDAMRFVATGEPIPGAVDSDTDDDDGPDLDMHLTEHTELTDLRYEIMFLLDAKDKVIPKFKEAWGEIGDSIVVVGGDGLFNCHVHSDDVGAAIEVALDYGRPSKIRITDLMEQVSGQHGDSWLAVANSDDLVETGVVAVLNGDGLVRLYRSLGVQTIVTGGQSMNPSVAELLNAVEATPAQNVIILPNNKNILAAANQIDALTYKSVKVLPTTSMVEGLSALVSYDPAAELDSNFTELEAGFEAVISGEVTQAVRDSENDTGKITEGDWLGVGPDGITVITKDLLSALTQIIEQNITDEHEILTIVEGKEAAKAITAAVLSWAKENHPDVEVQVQPGGQPLYPYLFGLE